MSAPLFRDRRDAGRQLAHALERLSNAPDPLVLGLPRGGLPVAAEVAEALQAPLDVFVVRKLGVPGHPELAMGAIASGGIRVINAETIRALEIDEDAVDAVIRQERTELERRERAYRGDAEPPRIEGRTVILVDDGIATGATMRAAAEAIRGRRPERLVIAAAVAPREVCRDLRETADEVVCLETPRYFRAVGLWYESFPQTTDDEVRQALEEAGARSSRTEEATRGRHHPLRR